MLLYAVLATGALAVGLQYVFAFQDDHESVGDKSTSNSSQGSDNCSRKGSDSDTHHQDQEKTHFPTAVPINSEHSSNLHSKQKLRKESHDSKSSEYLYYSTSTLESSSTITSKTTSSTDSTKHYPTLKPTSVPQNSDHCTSFYARNNNEIFEDSDPIDFYNNEGCENSSYARNNNEGCENSDHDSYLSLSSSPKTKTSSSVNRSLNSSPKLPQSSLINSSSNFLRTPTPPTTFFANPSLKPTTSPFLYKAPEFSTSSPSFSGSNPSSQKLPPTLKPILSQAFSPRATTNQPRKANYSLEEDDVLPLYITPEDVKDLIKKGIVPEILKKTLSPSRYKDYFSALLYAEDYYYEKWSDYKLLNVTLELHKAAVFKKLDHRNKNMNGHEEKDDKVFVAFKMDAIPERRPYLLSRDFVYARPSGSNIEVFQGIFYRVKMSNLVLVEFNDEFHSQHHPTKRYDISFSFNRVCLKRAHQALNSISDSLIENFLFPYSQTRKTTTPISPSPYLSPKLDHETSTAIRRILAVQSSPPYLIYGPRCASKSKSTVHLRKPSRTGEIILESVIQIYRTSPNCRILICSPSNSACDVLMRALKCSIPESAMFRANAAFREKEDVPEDILSSSLIQEECFACPPIHKLREFKVIFSTFVSCYRLHNEGLPVGHFSHIFMVDTSSAIEPEAMVVLANFAGENTAVVVAGEAGSSPRWVRSEIGRRNGLQVSYFERLSKFRPYLGLSPEFITDLYTEN